MLNKITKLICTGVIIGLNGLCVWGNRIDVFYEGGPTLVAEGINGVELPQELSDPSHDLWDEYDPYVKFVGIRLNLPQELIADCEDKYWKIHDDALIQELEEVVSTEESFHAWCNQQEAINYTDCFLCKLYSFVLPTINEKNYFISDVFCKKVKLDGILYGIHGKKTLDWNYKPFMNKTPIEKYLKSLESIIKYDFQDQFYN